MTASEFYAAKPEGVARRAFRPYPKYVSPYGVIDTVVDGVDCKIVPQDFGAGKLYNVYLGVGSSSGGSPAEALAAARYMIRVQAETAAAIAAGIAARDAERAAGVAKHQAKQARRAAANSMLDYNYAGSVHHY